MLVNLVLRSENPNEGWLASLPSSLYHN